MTTTVSMARPTTGAGPTPTKEQHVYTDNRPAERLIDAINGGHIYRRTNWTYGDRRNYSRDVTDLLYQLDEQGLVDLFHDGTIVVTKAGQEWRDRPRRARTPKVSDPFTAGVAA